MSHGDRKLKEPAHDLTYILSLCPGTRNILDRCCFASLHAQSGDDQQWMTRVNKKELCVTGSPWGLEHCESQLLVTVLLVTFPKGTRDHPECPRVSEVIFTCDKWCCAVLQCSTGRTVHELWNNPALCTATQGRSQTKLSAFHLLLQFSENCPKLLQTVCIFVGLAKGVGSIQ